MYKKGWKGVTRGRKPTEDMGADEIFLTWWLLGWRQDTFRRIDRLHRWDEEKGEFEEAWLAWVAGRGGAHR